VKSPKHTGVHDYCNNSLALLDCADAIATSNRRGWLVASPARQGVVADTSLEYAETPLAFFAATRYVYIVAAITSAS
jgi:hypothetical protein